MGPFPGQTTQTECLILGNGPSLKTHDLGQVPRERVYVMGVNQSWRVEPHSDAHVAVDFDQYSFEDRNLSGFGGRAYYERHAKAGTLFHPWQQGEWYGKGARVDVHNALGFSRHPLRRRHKDGNAPVPPLSEDGGVSLSPCEGPEGTRPGSTAYVALQIAAPYFDRIWFVGLDMGLAPVKFDGARGYTTRKKAACTDVGAWSNSDKHDTLWSRVPPDVAERIFVIAPSATQVLRVVSWPWGNA